MNPNREKKATVTAALAAVKRGLRNRWMSSIGSGVLRSRAMKVPNRTAVAAKPAMLRALLQPTSGASMIVKISNAIAAVERAKPGRSTRGALGSREVGTEYATSAPASNATGAIAKKMLVQEK